MKVERIVNHHLTSNSYIIYEVDSSDVWLIDVGETDQIIKKIPKDKSIKGVFLTHCHYDHIYGLNKLIDTFPDVVIFSSEKTREGLYSSKLNLSFYHDSPFVFTGSNVHVIKEKDSIEIFSETNIRVIETPGHNWGCLSFKLGNYLFTGDSFIPGVKVVTKLKGGDKEANALSLIKIEKLIAKNTIVCPGHRDMTK